MQLTNFTDYALRVILYAGLKKDRCSVAEIAEAYQISKNHLIKVVHRLSTLGLLQTSKGRGGGIELSSRAGMMKLGDLVQLLEPDFNLVECFDKKHNRCPLIGSCRLETKLYTARRAFFSSLNETTINELLKSPTVVDERKARLGI